MEIQREGLPAGAYAHPNVVAAHSLNMHVSERGNELVEAKVILVLASDTIKRHGGTYIEKDENRHTGK
jgi:hypothetical protein